MPRETYNIDWKNPKLITSIDLADMPPDGLRDGSSNIDLSNSFGKLVPIKSESIYYSDSSTEIENPHWLIDNNGKYHLIHNDRGNIKILKDFYGTPTIDSVSAVGDIASGTTIKEEVYLGIDGHNSPKWVGYQKDQLLATITPQTVTGTDAFIIDATESTSTGDFIELQIVDGENQTNQIFLTSSNVSSGLVGFTNFLKITQTNAFSSILSGDYVYADLSIINISSTQGKLYNGNFLVLQATPDYIVIEIEFDSSTESVGDGITGTPFIMSQTTVIPTWKYSLDSGATWSSTYNIIVNELLEIVNGIKIEFTAGEGWSSGDLWYILVGTTTTSPDFGIEDSQLRTFLHDKTHDDLTIDVKFSKINGDNFVKGKYYTFGYSVLYGSQESPIHAFGPKQAGTNSSSVLLTVKLDTSTTQRSRRATGICIYGADSNNNYERNIFRLIKEIKFNAGHWEWFSGTTLWVDAVVKAKIETNGNWNESYESRTGIVDTISNSIVNYNLSTTLNNTLFVADATKEGLDSSLYMFRSQPNNYSMFNWVTDLLKLPKIPTAMVSYVGKIWLFTKEEIYRINYDLFIEDITYGIGCQDKRNVVVTEYGMFWHDANGVYMHDGKNITIINKDVKNTIPSYIQEMVFDGIHKCLLLHPFQDTTVMAYYVTHNSWMKQTIVGNSTIASTDWYSMSWYSMFSGKNGENYISVYDGIVGTAYILKLFSGNDIPFTAYTGLLGLGENGEHKKFYKAIVDAEVTPTSVQYELDRGTLKSTMTETDNIYDLSQVNSNIYPKGRYIGFKIISDNIINGISLIFRRLWGKNG